MRFTRLLKPLYAFALFALCVLSGQSQNPVDPKITKEIQDLEQRLQKLQSELKTLQAASAKVQPGGNPAAITENLDKLLSWRSIGPANMSGRITALAVFEPDPTCFYVATASGGLLKTVNNGSTFTHHFDRENTVSIGALAVAPTNRDILWVGTGEANPRNSVSYGDGVYLSTDGGKSWQNKGLKKTFQIGKIVIHPTNHDIVYVAALGRLYGPNEERGVYKTTDGGKTWERVWYLDDKTGALELVMHPADPNVLLLASWERRRDEFDSFVGDAKVPFAGDIYSPVKGHGPNGGLFKSTDGGKTWKRITEGLPKANLGRIGLDWHRNNHNLIWAIIDSDQAGVGLTPSKGYLGILPENTPRGVAIATLEKNSPATKSKLAIGNILLALDGKDIKSVDDLLVALQPRNPGDKIKLTVQRGDKQDTVEITLAPQPGGQAGGGGGKGAAKSRGTLGVQVEETDDGVVISEVVEEGSAHKAGLQVGDVILTLGGSDITTLPVFLKLLANREVGDSVPIAYQRTGMKKEVTVTLGEAPTPPGRPFAGRLGGQKANVQNVQGPDGIKTGGIYKSLDGGESWRRVNSLDERPFYFSVVRGDPNDEQTVYALGIPLYRSTDGGKTFTSDGINKGVHSDIHDTWINPKDSRHLLIGTDGGVYVSYDRAANWEFFDYPALGQFYHVAVDARRPYRAYGGLQDNGSWGGPSQTLRPSGPTNSDYINIQGGDGFVCRIDPSDPDIVYSESQNGNMFRRNLRTGESKLLKPKAQAGAAKYRFNWNTPFILSHHNSHVFYAAGNYVFRSVAQGEDMKIISPEITRTGHGTATALAESPKNADVVWVGSDDGALWLTRDGGKTWTDLSSKLRAAGLPGPRWIATIEASRTVTGRCYVALDAHRSDDDEPYLFVTEDFGQTWKSLRGNLPTGSTRVLREDIINPDLLYVGTEFAAFVSFDRGVSWHKMNGKNLPTVAVHEFAQATTAGEIVAATHGRSLWVLDVTTLRQIKPSEDKSRLFAPAAFTRWQLDFTHEGMFKTGTRTFAGQNPPRLAIVDFFLPQKATSLSLKVMDPVGNVVRNLDVSKEADAGLHRVTWDLVGGTLVAAKKVGMDPDAPQKGGKGAKGEKGGKGAKGGGKGGGAAQLVKPGVYAVVLEADGRVERQLLTIEADPRTKTPGIFTDEAEELRRMLNQLP